MKGLKFILILLVSVLLVGCTKKHEHVFSSGKCECGEVDPNYQAPHTHIYIDGKCSCGEKDPNYVPPHIHEFIEGVCECGVIDTNYVPEHTHEFIEGNVNVVKLIQTMFHHTFINLLMENANVEKLTLIMKNQL